ncbi:MAG: tRNA adenosine(34) deaminase TadA [Bacillota bacterium]
MDDHFWMGEALAQARLAMAIGEVPVGAVVVKDGYIVARAHNRRETDRDPTAHAEMVAIREAARMLGGWRLTGCTLYVTMEPCPMCAGAMVQARIDRLVYGAADPKAGAAGSLVDLVRDARFNHRVEVTAGVREAESRELLHEFFARLRRDAGAVERARLENG